MSITPRMAATLLTLLCLLLASPHALAQPEDASELRSAPVEDFGVVGFRHDFFATLTVTPRDGQSLVTYEGEQGIFEPDWVERGVEFVAYRIHKNDVNLTSDAYYPAVLGSRYARVVRVIDAHNLLVDFEYNGGDPDAPHTSHAVSGYFFIDCAAALREMVRHPDRPDRFIFEAGRDYVVKGMPNIPFHGKEQDGDLSWVSSDPDRRATIKISAEDAIAFESAGETAKLPGGAFFMLDTHDHSIYLDRINIIGPTYTVPAVQAGWGGVMFSYSSGECERTLEIRDCNTFAEKHAWAQRIEQLPEGANWVAPGITGIVGGGGKRGDRGDGVIDIVGYQRFNLIRSTWIARGIHSIKNNDGAGNWITIDGVDLDEQGRPVHMVYEATYVKRNRFPDVMLSFHDFEGNDARRGVRVASPDFSWPMLENQYWTGGTSNSSTEPTTIEVDGFTLYFGNNGDWRRELQDARAYHGIRDASEAVLFDRIPQVGDAITIEKTGDSAWRVWGWGVQVGDVLEQNGQRFEIATRERKYTDGAVLGIELPGSGAGYAHYWQITFKDNAAPVGEQPQLKVVTSRTAYLLDGRPRQATAIYERDLHGHWQYNRAEVNYEFRNINFAGFYRQTAGPAGDAGEEYQGLWELPVTQEWINCWAMQTDGSTRGEPARETGSEAFNKTVLQLRNAHPDSLRQDHHILVDGGRLFIQRLNDEQSPVWLRNHPQLIYGTASFGEPRLCNPVMLDDKGIDGATAGVSISLIDDYTLDLSNSVFGEKNPLRIYGHGTVILDHVRFDEATRDGRTYRGGVMTDLANGLQRGRFVLHLRGSGGVGGFRLVGEPEDGSVTLSDWTLGQMIFTTAPLHLSEGWLAIPNVREKIVVNGKAMLAE